jgi:hypothetical protein
MEDLNLQDLARPRQADHQSETLPTALQEIMELIGLGSLDCATIISRQIISFQIATNRAVYFVTLLSRSRTTQNRFVKSCLKCVCKLKMPASLTNTKNSSHFLPKLRTAKKLDRKETMLTPTTFSLLILQTSERDHPVRGFTMQSNVRIFIGDSICHRYLTSTPQLTDAVLQKKSKTIVTSVLRKTLAQTNNGEVPGK